jgi:hypothetical protein
MRHFRRPRSHATIGPFRGLSVFPCNARYQWMPLSSHGTVPMEVVVEQAVRKKRRSRWPILILCALGCGDDSWKLSPYAIDPADWHVSGCRWAAFEGTNPASAWSDSLREDDVESAFVLRFVVLDTRKTKSFFVDHYDMADERAVSFEVVDTRVPGTGTVFNDCTRPHFPILGQVWTPVSGTATLDCAWLEEVDSCKEGEVDELFNAIFLMRDLVLGNELGETQDVGTFGPLHAVIGSYLCDP